VCHCTKKRKTNGQELSLPTSQMAHLVFADTQPNAEKPKEPFFANALTKKTLT